ncbi:hypothetical protein Desti_0135 [Desulfomonile tiedjei DSM 6799]|uniref:Uncharacterized protein n=1 Tax=Desulfomonile tiedjei (strain ATCC 49306 / DSM 6799 / DCB-1) TaxID=706587 RepID=I4BZZ1_DESTA|nr:hypothetical protein Desti_0135 [Desulfomonile tiedjei DSM 6799]
MRCQRNTRLVHLIAADVSGGLGQTVTRYRCIFRVSDCCAPTFLPPFAPRPLRRLNATMEALTSVCVSPAHRSPCFTYSTVQTIPSPTTWWPSVIAFTPYPSARQISRTGTSATQCLPNHGSRLRHRLAGSPKPPGRNRFVILRTGRSPPVALHPASRRRSYSRLQAGEGIPGEDLHLSDQVRSQAH